jgi:hypothetical protein
MCCNECLIVTSINQGSSSGTPFSFNLYIELKGSRVEAESLLVFCAPRLLPLVIGPASSARMEAELQGQIPGLDHVIIEYSVVSMSIVSMNKKKRERSE